MKTEAPASNLLLSKLAPPVAGRNQVPRAELSERVFSAEGTRLILIRAPAGFGKTTLMGQLRERFQREGSVCAWINVDDGDNELPRFLSYLGAALSSVMPVQDGMPAGSDEIAPDDSGSIIELMDRMARHRGPFVLFLDEFEALRNRSATQLVDRLIDRLPPGALLVIGTRSVPALGLARLRVRDQLVEIDAGQLRFSGQEARSFLNEQRHLKLKPAQIERLHRTTEGWAAALRLAAVALERRDDADTFIEHFAGSSASVADYLTEDVFAGLDEPLREFMMRTSVLDQHSPALCDAVCGDRNSGRFLERIERANLFLVPLDEDRSAYRYHSLFLDFLRSQLRRNRPDWLAPAHRAAAQWYLSAGRPIPALNHAIESGDHELALPLLERHAEALLQQGHLRPLLRWFEHLPRAALAGSPGLLPPYVLATALTRGGTAALALLDSLQAEQNLAPATLASFTMIRPLLMGMAGQVDEAYAEGMRALRAQPSAPVAHRAWVFQTLANCSMVRSRFNEARRYADDARKAANGESSAFNLVLSESLDGAIDLIQGRLRQATIRLRSAAGAREADARGAIQRNVFPGVLLAETLYEGGDLEGAERLLGVLAPLTRELLLPDHLIASHLLLARIVGDRGDDDQALGLLEELEQIGHRISNPRVVGSSRIERSRHLLRRGDVVAAREQLRLCGEPAFWSGIEERSYVANDVVNRSIGRLRWLIRTGDADEAVRRLKDGIDAADAARRNRRALKLRILLAEALHLSGQRKLGLRMIRRASEFAAAEGFTATFLEEGPGVVALLQDLIDSRDEERDPLATSSLAHLQQLLQPRRASEPGATTATGIAGNVESFTPKQLEVLELLAKGYSNNAMADKLLVSETTVRTHLRAINVKLQAGNRTQALVIARRLRIIS